MVLHFFASLEDLQYSFFYSFYLKEGKYMKSGSCIFCVKKAWTFSFLQELEL